MFAFGAVGEEWFRVVQTVVMVAKVNKACGCGDSFPCASGPAEIATSASSVCVRRYKSMIGTRLSLLLMWSNGRHGVAMVDGGGSVVLFPLGLPSRMHVMGSHRDVTE